MASCAYYRQDISAGWLLLPITGITAVQVRPLVMMLCRHMSFGQARAIIHTATLYGTHLDWAIQQGLPQAAGLHFKIRLAALPWSMRPPMCDFLIIPEIYKRPSHRQNFWESSKPMF